jgi:hypothetical protein
MLTLRAALLVALLACAAAAPARQQRRVRGGHGGGGGGSSSSSELPNTCSALTAELASSFFIKGGKNWEKNYAKFGICGSYGQLYADENGNIIKKIESPPSVAERSSEQSNSGYSVAEPSDADKKKNAELALMELLAGAAACAPEVAPCEDGTPVMSYNG